MFCVGTNKNTIFKTPFAANSKIMVFAEREFWCSKCSLKFAVILERWFYRSEIIILCYLVQIKSPILPLRKLYVK